jgi:hypothetical protein
MNEARQKDVKHFKNMIDNIGLNLCYVSVAVEVEGLNCDVLYNRYLRIQSILRNKKVLLN